VDDADQTALTQPLPRCDLPSDPRTDSDLRSDPRAASDLRSGPPADSDLRSGPRTDQEFADIGAEGSPVADATAGLASLSFVRAAIRRRRRVWLIGAVIGLVLGVGYFLVTPPAYQATTQAFLTLGPNEDLTTAINTDVALAESRPVAALALSKLGLPESVSTFLGSYTAAPVTNRVILITVSAPSSDEAVRRATDVTTAFLQFRADQLRAYQQLVSTSANQEIARAKAQAAPIALQVSAQSASSPTGKAKLNDLQTQLNALTTLQQSAQSTQQNVQAGTDVAVRGSYIINAAAPILHSQKKTAVLYAVSGLIAGLALSLGWVVVGALVSDRLRTRADIAHALGAPVRLSVGPLRLRRLPGRRRLADVSNPDIQHIARYLRGRLNSDPEGSALALVPADRADVAAVTMAALALSCAQQGTRVIVADLCPGAPAARLLGTADPGVHSVEVPDRDSHLVVVVPERDDIAPTGPLATAMAPGQRVAASADLVAAYSSADVLLTLADLDPMLGGDHLPTWATDVVVMVTAGRPSWTRVQAIGEMVRLAHFRRVSAVLVGADKTDEGLGLTHAAEADRDEYESPVVTHATRVGLDVDLRAQNSSHSDSGVSGGRGHT
jgi:capsular polysaccharide biosynthesis protein